MPYNRVQALVMAGVENLRKGLLLRPFLEREQVVMRDGRARVVDDGHEIVHRQRRLS